MNPMQFVGIQPKGSAFLVCIIILCQVFLTAGFYSSKSSHCMRRIRCIGAVRPVRVHTMRFLRMDDESQRPGVKDDLTTRDEYLATRFSRLSPSGHDLTPLSAEEIAEWDDHHEEYSSKRVAERSIDTFLGHAQRGAYVARVGGLPLFTSGSRLDAACDKEILFFTEPCDAEHVSLEEWDGSFSQLCEKIKDTYPYVMQIMKTRCVRSGIAIGLQATLSGSVDDKQPACVYAVPASALLFLPLDRAWPVESQPENVWGTEGQYLAYKQRD